MNIIKRICAGLIGSMLLAACGASDDERPPPPIEKTVFRDVVSPMDKARNVENVVMEQKRATDQALERNEGDGE